MSHLRDDMAARARALVALYPERRSALIPLCHLAQEQDGWLTDEAMEDIAVLCDVTPAEVRGTATFYDMLHTEPVGEYVISLCTNIACLVAGAAELLEHAEERLGVRAGGTTTDGRFTLEEAECLADCDIAPCVQVNHRFVRRRTAEEFDRLLDELESGALADDVPRHGTLIRVRRDGGLRAETAVIAGERRAMSAAQDERAAAGKDAG